MTLDQGFDDIRRKRSEIHHFGNFTFAFMPMRQAQTLAAAQLFFNDALVLDLQRPTVDGMALSDSPVRIDVDVNNGTHFDNLRKVFVINYFQLQEPPKNFPQVLAEEVAHGLYVKEVQTHFEAIAVARKSGIPSQDLTLPPLFADLPAIVQAKLRTDIHEVSFTGGRTFFDFDPDGTSTDEATWARKYQVVGLLSLVNEFIAKRKSIHMLSSWTTGNVSTMGMSEDALKESVMLPLLAYATEGSSLNAWGLQESTTLWKAGWQYLFPDEARSIQLPETKDPHALRRVIDKRYEMLTYNLRKSNPDTFSFLR